MGISLAIEGIDGSGKRTLAENLKAKFESIGLESEIISFPRHKEEFSGELVDKFLYDGLKFNDDEYKAVREGMLYAIDRMVSLGRIRENGKSKIDEYNENKIMIFDRYLSSNFIHRCNNMDDKELISYIRTMEHIEFGLLGLPQPDITLVLLVKPEVSYNNIIWWAARRPVHPRQGRWATAAGQPDSSSAAGPGDGCGPFHQRP